MHKSDSLLQVEYSLDDLEQIAEKVADLLKYRKVICFHGDLGSGKTTLITAICRKLGVLEDVNSPSFSLVNEYKTQFHKIYHFDFYRIKNSEEAYDMGIEMYLNDSGICFIEWPEKIGDILDSEPRISITIKNAGDRRELKAFLEK